MTSTANAMTSRNLFIVVPRSRPLSEPNEQTHEVQRVAIIDGPCHPVDERIHGPAGSLERPDAPLPDVEQSLTADVLNPRFHAAPPGTRRRAGLRSVLSPLRSESRGAPSAAQGPRSDSSCTAATLRTTRRAVPKRGTSVRSSAPSHDCRQFPQTAGSRVAQLGQRPDGVRQAAHPGPDDFRFGVPVAHQERERQEPIDRGVQFGGYGVAHAAPPSHA